MDNLDPEIRAMVSISAALDGLRSAEKKRLLNWVVEKYDPKYASVVPSPPQVSSPPRPKLEKPDKAPLQFDAFADMIASLNPTTTFEKSLVCGYWLQVIRGADYWSDVQVANLLKGTGENPENVKRQLETLRHQQDPYVEPVVLQGKPRSDRKLYKLTDAGIHFVLLKDNKTNSK